MARLEEFRIGNYFENWLGVVIQMDKQKINHFTSEDKYYFRTINVNQKWIYDFGLFNDYKFSDVGVDPNNLDIIYFFGGDINLKMPKYVHRLQNLVYEITDIELKIK